MELDEVLKTIDLEVKKQEEDEKKIKQLEKRKKTIKALAQKAAIEKRFIGIRLKNQPPEYHLLFFTNDGKVFVNRGKMLINWGTDSDLESVLNTNEYLSSALKKIEEAKSGDLFFCVSK